MTQQSLEYYRLHGWVRWRLGRAKQCEVCGTRSWPIDWANISGNYLKDTSDYVELCRACHGDFDCFGGFRRDTCRLGHKKVGGNLVRIVRKDRRCIEYACRTCGNARAARTRKNKRAKLGVK